MLDCQNILNGAIFLVNPLKAGQLPRLLGGLIKGKGSIHVTHQPQDQGEAVDVRHGPLPQEKAGLENPPRMLGDWRF